MTYRTGNHWGVTIVREPDQPTDGTINLARAQLVAVVVDGDTELAERICALLNADDRYRALVEDTRPAVDIVTEAQVRASLRPHAPENASEVGRDTTGTNAPCCDLHGPLCEAPSELCCHLCTEAAHVGLFPHSDGTRCVLGMRTVECKLVRYAGPGPTDPCDCRPSQPCAMAVARGAPGVAESTPDPSKAAQRSWGEHPAHPTCIDVTPIDRLPGSEWVCGPECPRRGEVI